MQIELPGGWWLVCGRLATEPKYTKTVGKYGARKCTASLITDEERDPADDDKRTTTWCSIAAWSGLATVLRYAEKWDRVLVIGKYVEFESGERVFKVLDAAFLTVTSPRKAMNKPAPSNSKKSSPTKQAPPPKPHPPPIPEDVQDFDDELDALVKKHGGLPF